MEIVTILRMLRRHRGLVALGVVVASLVGLALMYQISPFPPKLTSRRHTSGVASSRVLVAIPNAPSFDLDSDLTDTVGTRTELLADLLSSDESRARIAAKAGVAPDQLVILGPATGPPELAIPLAVSATEAAATGPERYAVTVTADGKIPIILIKASGPDAVHAAKVVDAASASLDELIASRSPDRPGLLVERLGPAVGRTIVDSPKAIVSVIASLIVFVVWCAGLVVAVGLGRRWAAHRSLEEPARTDRAGALI